MWNSAEELDIQAAVTRRCMLAFSKKSSRARLCSSGTSWLKLKAFSASSRRVLLSLEKIVSALTLGPRIK